MISNLRRNFHICTGTDEKPDKTGVFFDAFVIALLLTYLGSLSALIRLEEEIGVGRSKFA